jgi:hypothetical protein
MVHSQSHDLTSDGTTKGNNRRPIPAHVTPSPMDITYDVVANTSTEVLSPTDPPNQNADAPQNRRKSISRQQGGPTSLNIVRTSTLSYIRTFFILERRLGKIMVRVTSLFLCAAAIFGQQRPVESFVHRHTGRISSSSSVVGRSMTATTLLEPLVIPKEEHVASTTRSSILSNTISNDQHPTLGEVRNLLPADVFQVDTAQSLFYFAVDFLAVVTSMGFLDLVVTSNIYHSMPIWGQALTVIPLQVLTGFAMWCMWCIGYVIVVSIASGSRSGFRTEKVFTFVAHLLSFDHAPTTKLH